MKRFLFLIVLVPATLLVSCASVIPERVDTVTAPEADMMDSSSSMGETMMEEGMNEDTHMGETEEQMMEEQRMMMDMPYEGAEGEYEMMDDNGNMMRNDAMIQSFDACIAAGYPMMKTIPPQCMTADGKVFVKGNESMGEPMMNPNMMPEEESVDHGGWVDEIGKPGQYTLFFDGVIGNGLESVLFFHAAWCPYCITHNTNLQSWYGSEKFPRSTYKIDYDTADELKKMFNVTNQDTFILIDGNGNEIKRVTFPSESALHELLGTF